MVLSADLRAEELSMADGGVFAEVRLMGDVLDAISRMRGVWGRGAFSSSSWFSRSASGSNPAAASGFALLLEAAAAVGLALVGFLTTVSSPRSSKSALISSSAVCDRSAVIVSGDAARPPSGVGIEDLHGFEPPCQSFLMSWDVAFNLFIVVVVNALLVFVEV